MSYVPLCLASCSTSMGVSIFFSLILSYFCFFVPALSPCHGRLNKFKKNTKITIISRSCSAKKNNTESEGSTQPSPEEVHKDIAK